MRADSRGASRAGAPRWSKSPFERLAARKALAQLIRRQDGPQAYAVLQADTASLAAALGLWSLAADALSAAAYAERNTRRFDEVGPLLERARRASNEVGDERGLVRADLVEGYVAGELGRHEEAIVVYRRASDLSWSIGMPNLTSFAEQGIAVELMDLGQFEAARGTLLRLRKFIETDASRYVRMIWLNDLGWLETRALESREPGASFEAADRYLASAVDLGIALESHSATANSLANRIYLAFSTGKRDAVRTHLERLESIPHAETAYGGFLAALVAASLDIEAAPHQAARRFEALHQRSLEESADEGSEYTWRSLLGLAESYEAMGALRKASAAYLEPLAALERSTRHASLRSARASFLEIVPGSTERRTPCARETRNRDPSRAGPDAEGPKSEMRPPHPDSGRGGRNPERTG